MGARKLKKSDQLSELSRYELLLRLASGGMGTVYLGVPRGQAGPIVAIKRAHGHLVEEASFRKMFITEARLASRIAHANAVGVLDVDESDGELLMVMQYVEGGSLAELLMACRHAGRRLPARIALRILVDAARGLHAAHVLTDARGQLLGLVHRDVSPQNILVGVRGTAAIVDFGVAKAASLEHTRTTTDILKGKVSYMAPEYLEKRQAAPTADVFSLGIVAWESLANRRLFKAEDEVETMRRILSPEPVPRLQELTSIDAHIAATVARAVEKRPEDRFPTALDFALELERAAAAADLLATEAEVGASVTSLLAEELQERAQLLEAAMDAREWQAVSGQTVTLKKSAPTIPMPTTRLGAGAVAPAMPPLPQALQPSLHTSPMPPQTVPMAPSPLLVAPARVAPARYEPVRAPGWSIPKVFGVAFAASIVAGTLVFGAALWIRSTPATATSSASPDVRASPAIAAPAASEVRAAATEVASSGAPVANAPAASARVEPSETLSQSPPVTTDPSKLVTPVRTSPSSRPAAPKPSPEPTWRSKVNPYGTAAP